MSDLLIFDEDHDGSAKAGSKDLDDLFEVNADHVTNNDSLDDILKPEGTNEIVTRSKSLKKKQKSIRRSIRKKKNVTEETDSNLSNNKEAGNKLFDADDDFDPFAPCLKKKGDANPTIPESSHSETMATGDSLDFLLEAQPLGAIPSSDDLLSLDPYSPVTRPKDKIEMVDSPTDIVDPERDLFGAPNEREAKAPKTKVKERKTNLSKSMERSFEDLLHGLSDESEPELDEMIVSDNDNTNLESILFSPEPPKNKKHPEDVKYADSPDRSKMDFTSDADMLTSTPNTDKQIQSRTTQPIEVKVHTPDDEEIDVKSWEMIDKDDVEDEDSREEKVEVDNDDDLDDVIMRNKNRSDSTDDNKDIDLSAIEDTNHLDVDINKHKSALGKKGSMALRRKQSRKSRRSVMTEGEDAIFQDSTVPKSEEMMNGDDDGDMENYDMSPPAKKPSPSMMIPLPGMSGPPPSQRLTASVPDDDDTPKPAKRVSKPPPGAFKLPDVMPRPSPKPSPAVDTNKKPDSTSHTFEKPPLRSAKPTLTKETEKEAEPLFETPVLKSVPGRDVERTPVSEDRDVMFEKPTLRSASRTRDQTPETKPESSGTFAKPTLRETPKRPQFEKKESVDTPTEVISTRNLRSSEKPDVTNKPTVEKHIFDKPKLRSTGRKESQEKTIDKNDGSNGFDKPVLRSAKSVTRDLPESVEGVSHTFDKPALKSTGLKNIDVKSDTHNVGHFDKPALRKTPSPKKEVKPPLEMTKGTFDKPSLRKTENSTAVSGSSGKSDYRSNFPETRLRKTTSPQKEVVPEKPSWLKEAADKQSKALDVIHSKENNTAPAKKETPSWLDKAPTVKGSRGSPLQDTSNGQSDSTEDHKLSRSREPSIGSENEPEKRKSSVGVQNNYVPSWMRQGRSPSVGNTGLVSPAKSTPNLAGSEDMPQWKKELAARRASRKEMSPNGDVPTKREDSSEPEWKRNIQLRKTKPGDTPAKDKQTVEPEWKKAAEEKRARLRKSTVEN